MNYIDDDLNVSAASETTVFRVYGGDSVLEGRYVTCERPTNPIQARCDLALSQHDFLDENGNPIRNMASSVAEGTIYSTEDGRIIDPTTNVATDNYLEFTEVAPTSDMPGGGLEYQLQDDFNHVVEIDNVDQLRHQPTEGWLSYVEAEREVMDKVEEEDADGCFWNPIDDGSNPDDNDPVEYPMEQLIEDEEYDIQKNDADGSFLDDQDDWAPGDDCPERDRCDEDWWVENDSHEEEGLDQLIENEEYDIQKNDVMEQDQDDIDEYKNETENEY